MQQEMVSYGASRFGIETPPPRFAVVIPVGPDALDPGRAGVVLASVMAWEPSVSMCVVVEDCDSRSGLTESMTRPGSCRLIVLRNPRRGRGYGHTGGLCAGILTALAWIRQNADVEFVLKLDTDALVVGPFAATIANLLAQSPETGIVGTLGGSCNPELRPLQDPRREPDLLRLRRLLPSDAGVKGEARSLRIDGLGLVPFELLRSFAAVRPHVDRAVVNGYETSDYCQGGAYALGCRMLQRMAAHGYLAQPEPWIWVPVGEDMVMAMYARAVGLRLLDASGPGQPFGLQARALPHSLTRIVQLGYSIIHSIRNDAAHSEPAIVEFFHMRERERRSGRSRRRSAGARRDG
jgi:hypothetical protein